MGASWRNRRGRTPRTQVLCPGGPGAEEIEDRPGPWSSGGMTGEREVRRKTNRNRMERWFVDYGSLRRKERGSGHLRGHSVTGFLAGLRIPHSDCSLKSVALLGRIYYGVKNSVFGSVPMLDRLLSAILETCQVLCLPDDSQPRTAAENVSGANNGTRLGRKTNSAAILESAGKKKAKPLGPAESCMEFQSDFVWGQGFFANSSV